MASIRDYALVLALLSTGTRYAGAWQPEADQQPAVRTVQYAIYDDPDSPSRQVIWRVALELHAADSDGNVIGWAIDSIELWEAGSSPRLWADAAPEVDTPDGLWWVTHAQPSSPQSQEFDMPPYVSGMAAADDPNGPDLEYELAGTEYTAPPGGPHFAAVAALDIRFNEENEPSPLVERMEESVEILDDPLPPAGY